MIIFFDSWDSLTRTFVITILSYVTMVFLLRISGKRTLSKMNAFDFIVTVALGSTLATVSLNKNVALADGAMAFSLLIFLQYIFTWLSVRIKSFKKLITSEPTLLLYRGKILSDVLKKERITIQEIYLTARKKGITKLDDINIVILETTGDLTIIQNSGNLNQETLQDVKI